MYKTVSRVIQRGREGISERPSVKRRLKRIDVKASPLVREEHLIKLSRNTVIARGREIQRLVSVPKFAHVAVRFDPHRRGWWVKASLRRSFIRTPAALRKWLANLPTQVIRRNLNGAAQ